MQFSAEVSQVAHLKSQSGHNLSWVKNYPTGQLVHFPVISHISHSPKQGIKQLSFYVLQVPHLVLSQGKQAYYELKNFPSSQVTHLPSLSQVLQSELGSHLTKQF